MTYYFSKPQRERLEALCGALFDRPGQWRKIHKDPGMQIVENIENVPAIGEYQEVKPGKFTFKKYAADFAGEKGFIRKAVTRPMTYDELEVALIASLEMKNLAVLFKEGEPVFYGEVARRYRDGTLLNVPYLIVPKDEREPFDEVFAALSKEHQDELKDRIVPNANKKVFCVDGLKLVTEVLFQSSHTGEQAVAETCEVAT